MTLLPRLHRRRHHANRSSKSNPYADRGLEKFASVAAELSAKKQNLEAKLGKPVSFVRFTAVSQDRWLPVYLKEPVVLSDSEDSCSAVPAEEISEASAVPEIRVSVWHYLPIVISMVAVMLGILFVHNSMARLGLMLSTVLGFGLFVQKIKRRSDAEKQEVRISDDTCEESVNNSALKPIITPPMHLDIDAFAADGSLEEQSRKRFKCRFIQKHMCKKQPSTEPSSPSLSSAQAYFSFSSPSSPKSTYPHTIAVNFSEKHAQNMPLQQWKMQGEKKLNKSASALTAIWVVIAVGGLIQGYSISIVGVVCWWYMLPKLRNIHGAKQPKIS